MFEAIHLVYERHGTETAIQITTANKFPAPSSEVEKLSKYNLLEFNRRKYKNENQGKNFNVKININTFYYCRETAVKLVYSLTGITLLLKKDTRIFNRIFL